MSRRRTGHSVSIDDEPDGKEKFLIVMVIVVLFIYILITLLTPYVEATFNFEHELREMKKIIDKSIASILQTGADLSESGNYTESQEFADTLKGFLRMDDRVKRDTTMCEEIGKKLMRGDGGIEEARGILLSQTTGQSQLNDQRFKWSNVTEMKDYNELTWECGPGYGNRQGYPPIENDPGIPEDDDLVMQTRDSLTCPISLGILKDPMKNPQCGHTYSKASIETMFQGQRESRECPVSGCRGTVSRGRLIRDEKLERKLERISERIFK